MWTYFLNLLEKFHQLNWAKNSLGHSPVLRFKNQYGSVQFSHSVMSDSLWLHGLQHTMPPCPSPTPGVYSNSCPLSEWYHPTISSSVVPFSSCLQSFTASGSFPMSQFFASGGQSIRVSASASVLPMYIRDWFPLGLTGCISFLSKGLSGIFFNISVWKYQFFSAHPSLWSNSMTTRKITALIIQNFVSKVKCLLFSMLSVFVIAILSRSKCLLISQLQSLTVSVILEPKKIKSVTVSPIHLSWSDGTKCHGFHFFCMLSFKPAFSLSSFTFIKRFFWTYVIYFFTFGCCYSLKTFVPLQKHKLNPI